VLLAARCKYRTKKSPKIAIWAPSHNFDGLYLLMGRSYKHATVQKHHRVCFETELTGDQPLPNYFAPPIPVFLLALIGALQIGFD